MNHWFRLYNTLVDDPKVQQLPEALFKALINLWCVASQNDGVLPSAGDIGYKLRIKPERAAELVTRLVQAGLIDNVDGSFVPHNWDSRQFQSDSSTDRVKKHRDKKKGNVSGNVSSNTKRNVPETPNGTDRAEQNKPDNRIDVAEDVREPLVSDQARDLADELLVIAGHELRFVPPGWCGAAMRVHTWLANGWKPEVIVAATRAAAAKKYGAPANSVQFFEKAIAEEVARQAAPLPQVEIRQPEKLTVNGNGRPPQGGNIIQAADRLLDKIRSFDSGPGDDNGLRDGTGEASPRLLSQG